MYRGVLNRIKWIAFGVAWFAPVWILLIILHTYQLPPTVEFYSYTHCWPVHNVVIQKVYKKVEMPVDVWTTKCERRGYWRYIDG